MENAKPTFELSIDTRMCADALKQGAAGETVTFATIGAALGRKVDGGDSTVQSALRHLMNEDGIVFESVRGIGYKRLKDVDIVGTVERDRGKMRRHAKRVVKRLLCVADFDAMPNEAKIKHNAALSGFGAIASILKTGNMKKLEQSVERASQQLPLAKTLEAFTS